MPQYLLSVWHDDSYELDFSTPDAQRVGAQVDAFNAEPRTCAKCGTVQARFPSELMGWRRYAQYVDLANRARTDMEKAW